MLSVENKPFMPGVIRRNVVMLSVVVALIKVKIRIIFNAIFYSVRRS